MVNPEEAASPFSINSNGLLELQPGLCMHDREEGCRAGLKKRATSTRRRGLLSAKQSSGCGR